MPYELLSRIDSDILRGVHSGDFLARLNASKKPLRDLLLRRTASATEAEVLTLKVLNLCLAKYHFFARDTELLSQPFGLVVDPINNCNLACPGCVHSERSREFGLFHWDSGLLSPDRFEQLLRRYGPYAIEIMFCNYGEPLLNPHTPSFIRMAKTWLMRTGLSTNMTAKRFDAAAYVSSGLDFMTVSIDGASQAVYERYRKKGDLDLAFRNLRSLVAARSNLGKTTPIVSWQFLAFEHNAHEIDAAIAIARELGVDQFVVANPFDVGWDDPGVTPAKVEARTVEFHGDSDWRMIANRNLFPDGFPATEISRAFEDGWTRRTSGADGKRPETKAKHTCHWLYKNMVMDANGRVLPCCAAPKPETDLVFANAFDGSSVDSFNSEKYALARLSFSDPERYARETAAKLPGASEPYCANCEWNQTWAHTNAEQVAQYFRTAGDGVFNSRAIAILSSW